MCPLIDRLFLVRPRCWNKRVLSGALLREVECSLSVLDKRCSICIWGAIATHAEHASSGCVFAIGAGTKVMFLASGAVPALRVWRMPAHALAALISPSSVCSELRCYINMHAVHAWLQ